MTEGLVWHGKEYEVSPTGKKDSDMPKYTLGG